MPIEIYKVGWNWSCSACEDWASAPTKKQAEKDGRAHCKTARHKAMER